MICYKYDLDSTAIHLCLTEVRNKLVIISYVHMLCLALSVIILASYFKTFEEQGFQVVRVTMTDGWWQNKANILTLLLSS